MKANFEVRQEMSRYKLKDNVGYKVTYTIEDLQEALKNKEISVREYSERSTDFELKDGEETVKNFEVVGINK